MLGKCRFYNCVHHSQTRFCDIRMKAFVILETSAFRWKPIVGGSDSRFRRYAWLWFVITIVPSHEWINFQQWLDEDEDEDDGPMWV